LKKEQAINTFRKQLFVSTDICWDTKIVGKNISYPKLLADLSTMNRFICK